MDFLPIFVRLRGRLCAVIGGGEVAARKVTLLLAAGGRITVTAPDLCPELRARAAAGEIEHRALAYTPAALDDTVLVVAATDDPAVNAAVSRDAQARRLPVNVVDDPELCSFIMPAIIDRSPVVVAVSSGGASPVLARQLRARLESLLPANYGELAALAESFRARVKAALPASRRRRFWEDVLQGPIAELVFAGHRQVAEERLGEALSKAGRTGEVTAAGEVYFVATGSGDPDLLTFGALRRMQQADVVMHDPQVAAAILGLVRRDAEFVDLGKVAAAENEGIGPRLVELAQAGKRTLRLVHADPSVFARGSAEIAALAAAGIRYEVVPGVAGGR